MLQTMTNAFIESLFPYIVSIWLQWQSIQTPIRPTIMGQNHQELAYCDQGHSENIHTNLDRTNGPSVIRLHNRTKQRRMDENGPTVTFLPLEGPRRSKQASGSAHVWNCPVVKGERCIVCGGGFEMGFIPIMLGPVDIVGHFKGGWVIEIPLCHF